MANYTFLVSGSESEPYEITFYSDGKNFKATCTCLAGSNGQYCKHRLDILKGDTAKIVSANRGEVANVLLAFKESPLDFKLRQLNEELEQQEQLKRRVDQTKKEVAKIMFGR